MIYVINVKVEVPAESRHEAFRAIRCALDRSRLAEIIHLDSEVIDERPDEDYVPPVKALNGDPGL